MGRKPKKTPTVTDDPKPTELSDEADVDIKINKPVQPLERPLAKTDPGNHETSEPETYPTWSPRPGPMNCNYGPIITKDMLDQWNPMADEPNARPIRSTRNPNPRYVDS